MMSNPPQEHFKQLVDEHIKKNRDFKNKEVGDVVLVWDTSRLTDVETGEVDVDQFNHYLIANYKSIVIENGVKFNQPIIIDDRHYDKNLDIVLWNPVIGKKYRTSSDFIKIM